MSATAQDTLSNMTSTEAAMARAAIYHALLATEIRKAPQSDVYPDGSPRPKDIRKTVETYNSGYHQASAEMAMEVVSKLIGDLPARVWTTVDLMHEYGIKAADYRMVDRPDLLLSFLGVYISRFGAINLCDAVPVGEEVPHEN